jgi:hypothetical protein
MPTLTRFSFRLALVAAIVFAGMLALANLVRPVPREITVTIPLDLQKTPARHPEATATARDTNRLDDPKRLPKVLEASRLAR